MALELVTGYQGKDHVTAEQWADFNRGIYGDAAILPVGSKMEVDIQTANQITVKDGIGVFDGREVYIGYGETENIAIASGTQGMRRNDIVVIKYTKQEETGVESVAFEVIEGTPAASNQTDPAYSDQDIRTGVFTSQKPFCRVRINGTAIEGVDMLVDVKEIKEHAFNDLANNLTTTKPGHGLDARQGKILKDQLDVQNSALTYKIFGRDYGNIQRLELNMPIGTSALIIPQFGMYFVMRLSSGQFEVYEFSKTGGDIQHVEYADAGYIAFKYGESGDSSFRCLVLSTSSEVVPR